MTTPRRAAEAVEKAAEDVRENIRATRAFFPERGARIAQMEAHAAALRTAAAMLADQEWRPISVMPELRLPVWLWEANQGALWFGFLSQSTGPAGFVARKFDPTSNIHLNHEFLPSFTHWAPACLPQPPQEG